MSKNKSVQEKHKEIRRERREAERAEQKRKLIKRAAIIAVAVVLVAVIAITAVVIATNKYKASNEYKSSTPVMKSENYTIDLAMYTYYFFDTYYGFVDMYEKELNEMNMYPDITKDLNDQYNANNTWFEFFTENAGVQLQQNLVLVEAAKADGITLTDAEKEALKKKAESIDVTKYGEGVTQTDVLKCLELDLLGIKYEYVTRHKNMLQGEELEEYYDTYYKHFSTVDFRCLEIPYSDSEHSTVSQAEAENYANLIAEAKNSDEFTEKLYANVRLINPELTDDEVQQVYDYSFAKDYAYSEGDIVTEWLFDEEREINDTYVYHNPTTESYTVYLMTKLTEKDMNDTVIARHILFTADVYGSDEAAQAKANEVKALWEQSKTDEKFAELAIMYSEDRATSYLGGLLENNTEEELKEQYAELAAWCFGDVKAGDCAVVKSSAGYHLVTFIENGLPSALARTQSQVSSEKFNDKFTSYQEVFKIETFPEINEFSNV